MEKLLNAFLRTREFLARPGNDFAFSSWRGAEEALLEIDGIILKLRSGELPDRLQMQLLFAPTGPIQEVSLSSGWGDSFLNLAAEFDVALQHIGAPGMQRAEDAPFIWTISSLVRFVVYVIVGFSGGTFVGMLIMLARRGFQPAGAQAEAASDLIISVAIGVAVAWWLGKRAMRIAKR